MKKIPELDGLRGTAIVLVLINHLGPLLLFEARSDLLSKLTSRITGAAWVGVDIFFVLSGFLITSILIEEDKGRSYFRDFYIKRAFRILPAFICVFSIAITYRRPHSILVLLAYIFFAANWAAFSKNDFSTLGQVWSLSVEEQFYLFWPVIVRTQPYKRLFKIALSLLIGSYFTRLLLAYYRVDGWLIYKMTPSRIDGIAAGAVIAIGTKMPAVRSILQRYSKSLCWLGMLVGFIGFIACKANYFAGDAKAQLLAIPATVLASAGIVIQAMNGSLAWPVKRLLKSSILTWFGTRSYMIYLLHVPLIHVAESYLNKHRLGVFSSPLLRISISILVVIGVTVVVAELSWQLLEKRAIAYARRIAGPKPCGTQAVGPAI